MSAIICDHCKTDPGAKAENPLLWNGFHDRDTRQFVCRDCRRKHYRIKFSNPATRGFYSEVPVTLLT